MRKGEIPGIVQPFGSTEAHTRVICATECSSSVRSLCQIAVDCVLKKSTIFQDFLFFFIILYN